MGDLLEVVVAKTLGLVEYRDLREFPGVLIATSIGLGTYPKISHHIYHRTELILRFLRLKFSLG